MTEIVRAVNTEQLLTESRRVRNQLADAVTELDRYVAALQDYIDHRLDEAPYDQEQVS